MTEKGRLAHLYFLYQNGFTKRITVSTGIPEIDFYGITEGYVEYSYDGKVYIKGKNSLTVFQ